jgi:hypothetical protein
MTRHAPGRFAGLFAAAVLVTVAGCYQEPVAIRTFPPVVTIGLPTSSPAPSPTARASITPPPTPAQPTATPSPIHLSTPSPAPPTATAPPSRAPAGTPGPGCVNGWVGPPADSAPFQEGIAILEGYMGVQGPWQVADMRYFTGPDVPWILPGYDVVERWYIRASLVSDPGFRGRWLLEKRTDDIKGVSAVAPYDTAGYKSPDWTGFEGEGTPTTYIGLPGEWSGIPYDFVTGAGDSGQPGLPDEVVDCLTST